MGKERRGKFNILDLAVVVIILVLIFGAVYKFRGLDKTSKSASMETVTYEMTVESLRNYAFDHLNTVMRLVIIAGGLLLIDAGAVTDIVGIIIVVGISAFQQINKKRNLAG